MWLLALAGCGRLGFQDQPPITPDQPDAAIAPHLLACGSPTRFPIAVANEQNLTAVATTNGFAVFAADGAAKLSAWSYAFNDSVSGLAPVTEAVAVGTNANGQFGGAAIADQIVFASSNGSPATGTTLYGLTPAMATSTTPSARTGELAGQVPIATNGTSLAYATLSPAGDADLRLVDAACTDVSAPQVVATAAEMPSSVEVFPTLTGFGMGYATGANDRVEVATFDSNLVPIVAPIVLDAGTEMYSPWFAYAPAVDRYLVAWHQKDVTDDDDVWIMIVDENLAITVQPVEVAPFSTNPVVASDGNGFWVAYNTYDPNNMLPNAMAASHVSSTGAITPRAVTNTGGSPVNWGMVSRDGQAVLVWDEGGGTGPNLYLDPMCPGD
jgi:hypothetical protein